MKQLLITIAALVLVGCGPSEVELSLIEAARKGNIEAVKKHITNGKQNFLNSIDVNAADVLDKTALHYAAARGRIQIAELLIANGADVNTKSVTGRTPLDIANKNNKSKIADLLRCHGGKHGTIHGAALDGDIEAVKEFLAAATNVNVKNVFGRTPLHFAADKEIAELLIAKGADVNAKDQEDGSSLHLAAFYGHKEIAELLISKGADVNAKTKLGETPLDMAILKDHTKIAALLVKHGGKTSEELKASGN